MRVDSGVLAGSEITPLYDPMVAKLIVWDSTRELATKRMLRALDEFEVEGVTTLMPFHKAIMASEQWANAETCRDLIEDQEWLKSLAARAPRGRPAEDEDDVEIEERTYTVEVSGKRFEVKVHGEAFAPAGGGRQRRGRRGAQGAQARRAQGLGRRRRRRRAALAAAGQHVEGARRARARRSRRASSSASSRR